MVRARNALLLLVATCGWWPSLLAQTHIPAFGSQYAGRMSLDRSASQFVPVKTLVEPGALKAHWTSRTGVQTLTVRQVSLSPALDGGTKSDEPWCEDSLPRSCFELAIAGAGIEPLHFVAAYESFAIYAVDVDGDGVAEVAIERGEGQGTSVLVRILEIYKLVAGSFQLLVSIPLNGYLYQSCEPDRHPGEHLNPPAWERSYAYKRSIRAKGLDILLTLMPPRRGVRFVAELSDLLALQLPALRLTYDAPRATFVIAEGQVRNLK
jgi:hypothetical protein